jgi:prolactin regulatory element-binding protein
MEESLRKYGVPFYGVAWVPDGIPLKSEEDDPKNENEAGAETETETETETESAPDSNHVVLAGGGGRGNSGIKNAIVLAQFDPASVSLSHDPVNPFSHSSHN